jgi:hypothetical protein
MKAVWDRKRQLGLPRLHNCPANVEGDTGNLVTDGKLGVVLSCRDLSLPGLERWAKDANNG